MKVFREYCKKWKKKKHRALTAKKHSQHMHANEEK